MKNYVVKIFVLFILASLTGCGAMVQSNGYMAVKDPEKTYIPEDGKALVIFERTNNHTGSFHSMSIWDITDRDMVVYIGLISPTMKAAYSVNPGKYNFMAVFGGGETVMQAEVAADKTYYVMPSYGFGGLQFIPIKSGESNPVTNKNIGVSNDKALAWSKKESTLNSVQTHISKGIAAWDALSSMAKEKKTLTLDDGR